MSSDAGRSRNRSAENAFRVLDALAAGPKTRQELGRELGISLGQVDSLLAAGRRTGWITDDGDTPWITDKALVFYTNALTSLIDSHMAEMGRLRQVAQGLRLSVTSLEEAGHPQVAPLRGEEG